MKKELYTLITGASKGLGKSLALECANRQMNLVLVALPGEDLHELTRHIRLTYQVNAIGIEKDLTTDASCLELFLKIKSLGIKINILINNAGVGGTKFFKDGYFGDYEKLIRLNVLATTLLTRLFIDNLRENAPSYILNVGSLACFFSLEKKQVYGATKSYINYFSKSLRRELKRERIFVSIVCPGGMLTNDAVREIIRTGSYFTRVSSMHPEEVAPIAINGLLRKKQLIVPGRINRMIFLLNKILPGFIVTYFENTTMKSLHTPCVSTGQGEPDHSLSYSDIYSK